MSYDLAAFHERATKAAEHVRQDVSSLRTGRASVQLLDPVTVEAYGARMKLVEVASLSAPDANMLVVSPWDKSLLEAVARGISMADLQVNPVVDGDIIRISIPPLTEETRKEMVKKLHQKVEAGRAMLRSIRTDAKKEIEAQEGEAGVSEDDIANDLDELEAAYKKYLDQLETIAEHKEQELLTV